MNSKYYKVAGITVEVQSDFKISENTFHPKFRKFEVDGPGNDNILIRHHFSLPDLSFEMQKPNFQKIYNKDQWQVFTANGAWIYKFKSILPIDPGHNVTGLFNDNHTELSAHTTDFNEETYQNARFRALTLFNSDQVLFSRLLCDRNGLIFHSNGFHINGKGMLIAGISGSGKSTLSGMLKTNGYEILCDDKMFVTVGKTDTIIHGNWCHGSVPDASPKSAPLKSILILEQSGTNSINEIHDKRETVHHLLRSVVTPLLPSEGWQKALQTVEAIALRVKCFHVKFDLSGEIIPMVRKLADIT